jgi:hypothetical protein
MSCRDVDLSSSTSPFVQGDSDRAAMLIVVTFIILNERPISVELADRWFTNSEVNPPLSIIQLLSDRFILFSA